jgi:carboxylate-amine ligase
MHQSMVEVGTNICKDVNEARSEVTYLRRIIGEIAANQGLLFAAGGTHPFSRWQDQAITDHPRYHEIVDKMQDTARGNLIFGLHVHVGIPNREIGLALMNQARYFLPHIFALSANSPFWLGRNTGFKAYRTKVFDKFPRTGIPDYFSSVAEYDNYVNLLIKTNCIDNGKKIWWDLRLHPFFETIEFRICDVPMKIDETIAITALIQAVVAKIYKLMKANLSFRNYSRALINENKWRAARYGIEGKMIDFGKQEEVSTKDLIYELLDFVDDVVDDLGSRHELRYVEKMLEQGTGADRQLAVYARTGDLKDVVDYMVSETNYGL